MPPSTAWPIYELLTRYGVDHEVAKSNSMNDLRYWELDEIAAVLKRLQRPSRDYSYFRDISIAKSSKNASSRKWWQDPAQDEPSKWVCPPRTLMKQSAREKIALCINMHGQWSLRTSGYVALSHVWIEGLQRDKIHQGLSSQKVDSIFALLQSRAIDAAWIWTDALAIPSGGDPETSSLEDDTLTIDVINAMPQIYSQADAVLVIDALVLQLHPQSHVDVAIAIACGKWATRVWTYQEIKLASRALILTATGCFEYRSVVDALQTLKATDKSRYHSLWLRLACMMKDEATGISIPDIIMSCGTRKSGQDVDYARAFFPVLGLKWEFGMTREEGMQKIYTSYKLHASRVACFYGAPRLSIKPTWAPSSFSNLEGYVTEPMQWEERGIRGEWYAARVGSMKTTFINGGRFIFELVINCSGDSCMQCALAPNETSDVRQAFSTAVEHGSCYVLSAQPSSDALNAEFARIGLLVERATVKEEDGFEAAAFCAVAIPTRSQHGESKQSVLLRHWSPTGDGDLHNQINYHWHTQESNRQLLTLARRESESEIHAAVRNGDLAKVVELTENGEDIETFDANGWSPLHIATARDNCDILRYLLCQFPRKTDIRGNHMSRDTPLSYDMLSGLVDAIEIHLDGKHMNKGTPLSYAALMGQIGAIETLLEFGANVHARTDYGYTSIMVAAYERHAKAVSKLLSGGSNPNDEAGFSGSALLLASGAGKRSLPTLRALVEGGANVKPKHPNGFTPIHNIAESGSEDEMAYLIEQGCEADSPRWDGFTPVVIAIQKSNRECVRLLLDAGADRNRITTEGFRPVHFAAKCPNWQIMQMLLEKGDVDVNVQSHGKKETALHLAYEAKNTTVVKILMKAGADPNITDADGRTAKGLVDSPPTGESQRSEIRSPPLPPRPAVSAPPLPPRQPSHDMPPPLPPRQLS